MKHGNETLFWATLALLLVLIVFLVWQTRAESFELIDQAVSRELHPAADGSMVVTIDPKNDAKGTTFFELPLPRHTTAHVVEAWFLGGGYSEDITTKMQNHCNGKNPCMIKRPEPGFSITMRYILTK